jgi:hypothetical protein
MRTSNRFTDRQTGETYDWHINHAEEEEGGRAREITLSGNTSGLGLVRQQGAQQPLTLRWAGAILHREQFVAMWHWFGLCELRTIFLRDFHGDEYEVVITNFDPSRVRGRNPQDPSIPLHYWKYTIEMQVLQVISGDLAGVVTP